VLRSLPAHERLEACEHPRGGVDDRLVLQAKAASGGVGESDTDGGLDIFAFDHLALQAGIEDLYGGGSVPFGSVHGGVGAGQEAEGFKSPMRNPAAMRAATRRRTSSPTS
jgi:hypothetical protein